MKTTAEEQAKMRESIENGCGDPWLWVDLGFTLRLLATVGLYFLSTAPLGSACTANINQAVPTRPAPPHCIDGKIPAGAKSCSSTTWGDEPSRYDAELYGKWMQVPQGKDHVIVSGRNCVGDCGGFTAGSWIEALCPHQHDNVCVHKGTAPYCHYEVRK